MDLPNVIDIANYRIAWAVCLSDALTDRLEMQLLVPERNLGFGGEGNLISEQSTANFLLRLNPKVYIDQRNILMLMEVLRWYPRFNGNSPKTFWDASRCFFLLSAFPQTPLVTFAMTLTLCLPRLVMRGACYCLRREHGFETDLSNLLSMGFVVLVPVNS